MSTVCGAFSPSCRTKRITAVRLLLLYRQYVFEKKGMIGTGTYIPAELRWVRGAPPYSKVGSPTVVVLLIT